MRKPKLTPPTAAENQAINRGIATDPGSPEWSQADFAAARPASEVVPEIVAAYRRGRGPQKSLIKTAISLRLDQDVLEKWRSSGPGWQARMNEVLRKTVA